MKLVGGKSYENGIDFTVKDGNQSFIYSARRNEKDEIETCRNVMYERVNGNSLIKTIISAVLSLLLVFIIHVFKGVENPLYAKFGWLLAIAVFWGGVLSFVFFDEKSIRSQKAARYHSVEHKILNFYNEYGYLPRTTDDIEKMSSIYLGCGSTIAVVIALFATFSAVSIIFIPMIILKIIGIAISGIITLYLWANEKCNFVQKWTLKEPRHEEIELGVCAMHRLAKEISVL